MTGYKQFKRKLEWWREEGEQPEDKRLTEGTNTPSHPLSEVYTGEATKPAWDGVGGAKFKYANSKSGFGKDGINASKGVSVEEGRKTSKSSITEAFDDEDEEMPDDDSDLDNDVDGEGVDFEAEPMGDEDMGGEADVETGEMNDENLGEYEDETPIGDVDDIRITIGGQDYVLAPAPEVSDEDMGNEDLGDEDIEGTADLELPPEDEVLGDEGMDDEDLDDEDEFKESRRAFLLKKVAAVRKRNSPYKESNKTEALAKLEALKEEIETLRRKRALRARVAKMREERDTLGGKRLVTSKGADPETIGQSPEFRAPRTQGKDNKSATYKFSKSTGPYESKAFSEALAKIKARRAAMKEVDSGNIEARDGIAQNLDAVKKVQTMWSDDTLVKNAVTNPAMAERLEAIRLRRKARVSESMNPQTKLTEKLDFKKLMTEGYKGK